MMFLCFHDSSIDSIIVIKAKHSMKLFLFLSLNFFSNSIKAE